VPTIEQASITLFGGSNDLQIFNPSDMSLVTPIEAVGDGEAGGSPILFPFKPST